VVSEGTVLKARSGRAGRATFVIDREGAWLIKTIHMVRLPPEAGIEWDSHWATLSFHTARQ
jgi:alkyl hydroperoxide reductase subunit AhpC